MIGADIRQRVNLGPMPEIPEWFEMKEPPVAGDFVCLAEFTVTGEPSDTAERLAYWKKEAQDWALHALYADEPEIQRINGQFAAFAQARMIAAAVESLTLPILDQDER